MDWYRMAFPEKFSGEAAKWKLSSLSVVSLFKLLVICL
jgi:hypothetical protein